jgi:hypothetical protein
VLEVATLQETVTVTARAPEEPVRIALPPPRLLPDIEPVAEHASVCGPRRAGADTPVVATVAAVDRDPQRFVLGDRDLVVIDAGATNGIQVGANFVVRRRFVVNPSAPSERDRLLAEHTAALIQVVETAGDVAVARAVYVCDEMVVGDRVEPFDPQPLWTPAAGGTPDFHQPARVLFAAHGRSLAAPAEFVVIDRGADDGARPGQWVTMFRRSLSSGEVTAVGEALVVAVQATSATVRVENARDAIEVGDRAALHR